MVLLAHYTHKLRFFIPVLIALGTFLMLVGWVHAANVAISPNTGTYSQGQSFTVTIQTNPQGDSVNAVEAKLSFDNTKLSVISVAKTGSVFSLWTTEPTFSNSAGTIDFGGGSPTPFSSLSNLVTVTFRATSEGTANVSVSSASVLAADGLGTDVYTSPQNATFTIGAAEETEPIPTEPDTPTKEDVENDNETITFGDPPRAPEAGSTVFLDPDTWYNTKIGVFTWDVPFDVDAIALDVSTSSDYEPETVHKPPIESISLNEEFLTDGIQYLTLQYKNQVDWGAILHRKIMIDTIPPEPFSIQVRAANSKTDFPLLTFEADDTTSGIDRYELQIVGEGEPIEVTPDEARLGYLLGELEDGTYTVIVKAFDMAGNMTETSVPVLITAGWSAPIEIVIESTIWDFFKGKNLVIILLLLVIIGQFIYAAYERRRHQIKEQNLRKETREIQDQMEKIFSALRDEIYDQINMITKRERLSKKEREAVEGLNQALEVSETLLEKEITDVSKILK
jgi:hypothetical protein